MIACLAVAWLACVLPAAADTGAVQPALRVSFLDAQGPVAAAERAQFYHIVLLMMVVVLPVLLAAPVIVWRFRYRNGSGRYAPKWSFWWPIDVVIWGVPALVVVVLSVWLWQATVRADPYRPLASEAAPLRVDVIGYDWKWLFVYPDLGIASIGRMELPAGRPVSIRLTSDSVMQSFFIPALGSQIYAMAGMVTRLNLQADRPGRFLGENTQYNGKGFHAQRFVARAVPPEGFRAWVAEVKAKGLAMTPPVYDEIRARNALAALRDDLAPAGVPAAMPAGTLYFRAVPPDLLDRVTRSFHGGPASGAALLAAAAPPAAERGPGE